MVDYTLLLTKVKDLNFSNQVISWLHSYLSGRKQAVRDKDGSISRWEDVTSGVPQGSGLGPLLFLILINNIVLVLRFMRYMIYADDLQAYLNCLLVDLPLALQRVEIDVQAIHNWARENKLKLNIQKTKILIIGSGGNVCSLNLNSLHRINIDNQTIPYVCSAKNLGVMMRNDLSWENQINDISKKIFSGLRRFRSFDRALSTEV